MPQDTSEQAQLIEGGGQGDMNGGGSDIDIELSLEDLNLKITEWTKILRNGAMLVSERGPDAEPFKNIYIAIENATKLRNDVAKIVKTEIKNPLVSFYVNFALVHIRSSLAKWQESCDELSDAEKEHVQCIALIEKILSKKDDVLSREKDNEAQMEELKLGYRRCEYMLIYELTRYAILCSARDNQDKALDLLKRAEIFYHDNKAQESLPPIPSGTRLSQLDDLNSESSKDMFTYVLFYLGQAYKIQGEKEKAILYLHMVLRRQLEKGDYNNITWGADTAKMASVLMINVQAYQTARGMLVASTAVLSACPEEEKSTDHFRQTWAELGRAWAKFGVALLEASCDRLRDLEEQTKKPMKFEDKMVFSSHEKLSLEIGYDQEDYDTLLLIRDLKFPSLDLAQSDENEMSGRFVRDFDEGRAVFLATQRWVNIAKEYYVIDEFATDYIDIITDYSESFKHLSYFEPSLDRQIKMHRRRISLMEELLAALNPKVYYDIFYHLLRDLAETYEKVYKLKVEEIKDRGESLRPKDKKLVKWLTDAVDAHKRNLEVFEFDMKNPAKGFNQEYEKILLACILSNGRILGSICHDHPLHPNAIEYAEDGKKYYTYFLAYLDRRPALREEFRILYEGSLDMPELLDTQVKKIKHRLRMLNLS